MNGRNVFFILTAVASTVSVASTMSVAAAQDVAKGVTLFKQRCAVCHTVESGKKGSMGPNLLGVAGRKAGTQAGMAYSPAMQKSNVVWSKQTLDQFLTAPSKMVPGTRMPIAIPIAAQRAEIVAYLLSLKGK